MPRRATVVMLVLILGILLAAPASGQAERPSKAACEAAVRAGVQALTLQPREEAAALLEDWGGAETAAVLGLPDGCRVPTAIPAIEPLEGGQFMICLWWNPRTGELGEILDSGGWTAGWWECIGPPDA